MIPGVDPGWFVPLPLQCRRPAGQSDQVVCKRHGSLQSPSGKYTGVAAGILVFD